MSSPPSPRTLEGPLEEARARLVEARAKVAAELAEFAGYLRRAYDDGMLGKYQFASEMEAHERTLRATHGVAELELQVAEKAREEEETLRPRTPVERILWLRPALAVAGRDPTPHAYLGDMRQADAVERFVRNPRPVHLHEDPLFWSSDPYSNIPAYAEVLLGLVVAILCAVDSAMDRDTKPPKGGLFGEADGAPPATLLHQERPMVVRCPSGVSSDVLRSNVLAALRFADLLTAEEPPAFFLARSGVHGEPPKVEPGKSILGPDFFGFRIRMATLNRVLEPSELIASRVARKSWFMADETMRARYVETLLSLANMPAADLWALVPVISRIGDLLPPDARALLAARLPPAAHEAAIAQDHARQLLGAIGRGT